MSCSLTPLTCVDPGIFVNASTSWGIGLLADSHWAAWCLLPNWETCGCGVGWAEGVALELAVYWLVATSLHDADVTIQSDNLGVVSAFWKGHSHNLERDKSIGRITVALSCANLSLSPIFVSSVKNLADPLSHGCLGSNSSHIPKVIHIPPCLDGFLLLS